MNIAALKANTSSACFEEWKLAYKAEPWGDDWWQTGVMAAASIAPHSKRRVAPEDFMPMLKRSVQYSSVEDMERALAAMCGVGVA